MADAPLVYAIGLDRCLERAISADLAPLEILALPPLPRVSRRGRTEPCPALVLLDVGSADVEVELTAMWKTWGRQVVVVGVSRTQPLACIWRSGRLRVVEIGPGFLTALLPPVSSQMS